MADEARFGPRGLTSSISHDEPTSTQQNGSLANGIKKNDSNAKKSSKVYKMSAAERRSVLELLNEQDSESELDSASESEDDIGNGKQTLLLDLGFM